MDPSMPPMQGAATATEQNEFISSENVKKAIQVHQSALDDLVSVNSIFTSAVFLGLSFSGQDKTSLILQQNPTCKPGGEDILYYARRLVLYEVLSFAFFLMSSLVAKSLKMHLDMHLLRNITPTREKLLWNKTFRGLMLSLTVWGSIFGCIFLFLSMINIVVIRLGKLSCHDALEAAVVLISINSLALLIYIPLMCHAIFASLSYFSQVL